VKPPSWSRGRGRGQGRYVFWPTVGRRPALRFLSGRHSWGREQEDFNGREQKEVFFVLMNGNRKAIGKADLLRAIKLNLPELSADEERESHRPDVGVRTASAAGNGGMTPADR
jgi:hypothetical protein